LHLHPQRPDRRTACVGARTREEDVSGPRTWADHDQRRGVDARVGHRRRGAALLARRSREERPGGGAPPCCPAAIRARGPGTLPLLPEWLEGLARTQGL